MLQAKNIMFMPSGLGLSKRRAAGCLQRDEKNRDLQRFVIDNRRVLQGLVTIDDTVRAVKEKKTLARSRATISTPRTRIPASRN